MTLDDTTIYDVVIAGGGPVGLGLAIDLGQRGHSVLVLERSTELHNVPKGQNLTQRTMEHFRAWGCEDEIRGARIVPPDYAIGGMTSYKTLLSGYHYPLLQREKVRPYYYTDNERLPQFATERVLRARAEEVAGVNIRYGMTCTDLAQDREFATAIAKDVHGKTHRFHGRYLVGADGSRSNVRRAAGITQTTDDHEERMVLLVFKSLELHELLSRYPGKQFYCVLDPALQGYWKFFGRVDLGTTWFFHAPVPANTTRETYDYRPHVEGAVGAPIDIEVEYTGFWDLRFQVANRYRAGRVLIAGDACHSHPPYGGYGINLGLEDARNLGWKLSAVLQGWGGENLLDSYDDERRPVFESASRDFIAAYIREDRDFLNAHDPDREGAEAFRKAWDGRNAAEKDVVGFAPNYDGSPVLWGRPDAVPSAAGTHKMRARAGHHLSPGELVDGQAVQDLLGKDHLLIAHHDLQEQADAFEAAAVRLGVPLKVAICADCPAFRDWETRIVLVRPDHYVAWTGDGDLSAETVLRRCVGAP